MHTSSKFKRRLLSGTFLVISTAMASGCGIDINQSMGAIFGETRTVPEGDSVDFGNRHTPVLNPSTNAPAGGDQSAAPAPAGNNYTSSQPAPLPSAAPGRMAQASATGNMDSGIAVGRHVPVENQNLIAANSPPEMSAPVTPVMASSAPISATPLPPSDTPAAPAAAPVSTTAAVPVTPTDAAPSAAPAPAMAESQPAPAPQLARKGDAGDDVPSPVASGDIDLSGSSGKYPTLASVPPAPNAPTPKDQATDQLNAMVASQGQADTQRQQLMNNSSATVMTSPATGQLVANPDTAAAPVAQEPTDIVHLTPPTQDTAPQQTASLAPAAPPAATAEEQPKRTGFNSWLHNLFHKDQPATAAASAPVAAPEAIATAPASIPEATASAQPAPASSTGSQEVAPNVILGSAPAFPPVPGAAAPVAAPMEAAPVAAASAVPMAAEPAAIASASSGPAPVAVEPPGTPDSPEFAAKPETSSTLASVPPSDISTPAPAGMPLPSADTASAAAPAAAPAATPVAPQPAMPPFAVDASSQPPAAPASAPAPAAASVPAPATAADSVQLTPPMATTTAGTSTLPDVSQISGAPEQPVNLVPPSQSSTQMLPDSRYAARRSQDATTGN